MGTVSGIVAASNGNQEFTHSTSEERAPVLVIHQKVWTQVTTTETGSYIGQQLWVVNTGKTLLTDVTVTLTIQGGNGIWTPQFCDSSGNLLSDRYTVYKFGTLQPGAVSSVQSYWWKTSKPGVPQNGSAFDATFTAIPQFTVVYQDNDEFFTDKSHVTIG